MKYNKRSVFMKFDGSGNPWDLITMFEIECGSITTKDKLKLQQSLHSPDVLCDGLIIVHRDPSQVGRLGWIVHNTFPDDGRPCQNWTSQVMYKGENGVNQRLFTTLLEFTNSNEGYPWFKGDCSYLCHKLRPCIEEPHCFSMCNIWRFVRAHSHLGAYSLKLS